MKLSPLGRQEAKLNDSLQTLTATASPICSTDDKEALPGGSGVDLGLQITLFGHAHLWEPRGMQGLGWATPPSPLPQPLKCLQVLVGAQSCPAHLPPQVTTASTTTTNWGTGIEIALLITGNVCKAISWHGVYCSQSPASTTLSTRGTRDVARLACSRHLKHSPSALSLASQLGEHGLLSCPHSCPLFFLLHTPLKEMATWWPRSSPPVGLEGRWASATGSRSSVLEIWMEHHNIPHSLQWSLIILLLNMFAFSSYFNTNMYVFNIWHLSMQLGIPDSSFAQTSCEKSLPSLKCSQCA